MTATSRHAGERHLSSVSLLRRRPWLLIILTSSSVILHVWMLFAHPHGVLLTSLMAAMTAWCTWCTIDLVTRPTSHCLRRLLVMSLGMFVLHAGMLMGLSVASGHEHHHNSPTSTGTHEYAMLGIMLLEYMITLLCGARLRCNRQETNQAALQERR